MTRSELVTRLSKQTGLAKRDVEKVLSALAKLLHAKSAVLDERGWRSAKDRPKLPKKTMRRRPKGYRFVVGDDDEEAPYLLEDNAFGLAGDPMTPDSELALDGDPKPPKKE